MIKVSQLNVILFIMMFLMFASASKLMALAGFRIEGVDYYAWIIFAFILIALNFGIVHSKFLIKDNYFILALVLLMFCLCNYFFVNVPLLRYAQGTFFSFLFVANFLLFYNARFNRENFYFLAKLIVVLITLIAFFAYVERILFERNYNSYFLRGVETIVKDSSFASALLNINIILCLSLFLISKRRVYIYLVIFSIVTIGLLLFIKALLSAIIICFVFVRVFYKSRLTKLFFYGTALIFFVSLIFLGKPLYKEIEYKVNMYFGEGYEKIPRNALYIASIKIASDYFPFGSGQGTFGSLPVGKEYSQIYYDYGLDKVQGLSREDALRMTNSQFVFDTYWSSIIGEMGFIAGLLYLWLWAYPAIKSLRFLKAGSTETKSIAFAVVMMTVSIFIESIAAPLPGQLLFIMLYAGLGAVGYRLLTHNLIEPSY